MKDENGKLKKVKQYYSRSAKEYRLIARILIFSIGLGGFLFDLNHNYPIAFWVSLACLILSVFIVLAGAKVVKAQKGSYQ